MQRNPATPVRPFSDSHLAYFGGTEFFTNPRLTHAGRYKSHYNEAINNANAASMNRMAIYHEENGRFELAARWYFLLAALNIDNANNSIISSHQAVEKINTIKKYGGYPNLSALLGLCYAKGYGVPADPAVAKKYFEEGAKKKDGVSLFHLGLMTLCSVSNTDTLPVASAQLEEAAILLSKSTYFLTLCQQQLIDFNAAASILKNIALTTELSGLALHTFLLQTHRCYITAQNVDRLELIEQYTNLPDHAIEQRKYISAVINILRDISSTDKRSTLITDEHFIAYLQGSQEAPARHLNDYLHFQSYIDPYFERVKAALFYLKSAEDNAWKSYQQQTNSLTRFFSGNKQSWLLNAHTMLTSLNNSSSRAEIFNTYKALLTCLPTITPEQQEYFYALCKNTLATITLFGNTPALIYLDVSNQPVIYGEEPPPTFCTTYQTVNTIHDAPPPSYEQHMAARAAASDQIPSSIYPYGATLFAPINTTQEAAPPPTFYSNPEYR